MNPLTLNPLPLLGGAVVAVAIGFGTGWMVNGWRLESNLAVVQKDAAESRANSANAALDQLAGRLDSMNTATTAAQLDVSTLSAKMDLLRKEQKNAFAKTPLDPGCKPDADRLLNLRDAVGAANAAIKGAAPR
jgi:hypothetical protein